MDRTILHNVGMAVLAATLSACGNLPDDPANPPIKGNWTLETKIVSVALNNMNYGRDAFIAMGGKTVADSIETDQVKECFEPMLRDDDSWMEATKGQFSDCNVAESSLNGDQRHMVMQCTRGSQSAQVTIDGSIGAEEGHISLVARVSERKPTGATETQTLNLSQTVKRTGDCG